MKRTTVLKRLLLAVGLVVILAVSAFGEHTVTIFVREDGTRLDRIELELVAPAAGNIPSYIDAGAARAAHVVAALIQ